MASRGCSNTPVVWDILPRERWLKQHEIHTVAELSILVFGSGLERCRALAFFPTFLGLAFDFAFCSGDPPNVASSS